MGTSITPTFRIEVDTEPRTMGTTTMAWNTKINGRPTSANVHKWFNAMNESFQPGGVNEHAGITFTGCRVIRQATRETVVSFAL